MPRVGRVLLVDDDLDLLEIMRLVFVQAGAKACVLASSLKEVQAQRDEALGVDAAILDVNLGHGLASGLDVHRWLRDEGFAGRSVFLTGHARNHPLVQEAAKVPGTTVVSKPIDMKHLLRLAE